MKKSLLLGAAAIMALTANAQATLTKVWEHSMADHTTGETRSIAALGEYAVVPNKTTGMVELWDETGKVKEYDVNAFTKGIDELHYTVTPENGDPYEAVYGLGCAVSTDEAGNIIANIGFPNALSCKTFVAIQPDGNMVYLPCELPGGAGDAARMDYLGDKTAGDVTQNGFIIACPNGNTNAIVYNIYGDEDGIAQDLSYSYAVKIGEEDNTEAWNTESSAIPLLALGEDSETAPKFIARNRGMSGLRISADGKSALMPAAYTGTATIDFSKSTTTNFTAWTVGGKSYVALTQPDDGVRTHSWEVFDLETAESLARWTMPEGEAVNYIVGFASSVNADGTVNIFQYNPGIRLAKYTFSTSEGGVEGTMINDNAPVKYYNLQGVEIANPENGLFIKKQGTKATKVIL